MQAAAVQAFEQREPLHRVMMQAVLRASFTFHRKGEVSTRMLVIKPARPKSLLTLEGKTSYN